MLVIVSVANRSQNVLRFPSINFGSRASVHILLIRKLKAPNQTLSHWFSLFIIIADDFEMNHQVSGIASTRKFHDGILALVPESDLIFLGAIT